VTDGEILAVLGSYARVRLDVGTERWCVLRPGSSARPGTRVRLHPGPALPIAIPTTEVRP